VELPKGIVRRGRVLWVDVRVNGRRIRRPAGRTVAEAEQVRAQLLAEKPRNGGPSFDELAGRYLTKLRITAKPASVETAESVIRRLRLHFGDRAVGSLTADEFRIFQAARLARVSREAVNKESRYLRCVLRLALEEELIPRLPFKITMLRTPRKSPTILSSHDVAKLLDAAGPIRALLVVAAYTGLRNGELCALRWRDVELEEGIVHVAARDGWSPKSHRDRHILLHREAIEELRRQLKVTTAVATGLFSQLDAGVPGSQCT